MFSLFFYMGPYGIKDATASIVVSFFATNVFYESSGFDGPHGTIVGDF